MPTSTSRRVRKRPEALRAAGLHPVQIWMPDTRRPGFAAEAERQTRLVNEADARDPDLARFMDAALVDLLSDLDDRKGRE